MLLLIPLRRFSWNHRANIAGACSPRRCAWTRPVARTDLCNGDCHRCIVSASFVLAPPIALCDKAVGEISIVTWEFGYENRDFTHCAFCVDLQVAFDVFCLLFLHGRLVEAGYFTYFVREAVWSRAQDFSLHGRLIDEAVYNDHLHRRLSKPRTFDQTLSVRVPRCTGGCFKPCTSQHLCGRLIAAVHNNLFPLEAVSEAVCNIFFSDNARAVCKNHPIFCEPHCICVYLSSSSLKALSSMTNWHWQQT